MYPQLRMQFHKRAKVRVPQDFVVFCRKSGTPTLGCFKTCQSAGTTIMRKNAYICTVLPLWGVLSAWTCLGLSVQLGACSSNSVWVLVHTLMSKNVPSCLGKVPSATLEGNREAAVASQIPRQKAWCTRKSGGNHAPSI